MNNSTTRTDPIDRLRFGATTGVAIDAWFDDFKLSSQSMPQAFVPRTTASLLTSVFEQLWRWLRSWFAQPEAAALLSEPPAGRVWRSYYFVGSQRIALREQTSADPTGQVSYLLSDHLGSTTLLVNPNGVPLPPPQQYTSWGATRPASGEVSTVYQYTGQRNTGLGIYYYGARFYDPYLNHWLQPDTIIPDLNNPLDWDRFSYVRNNPINNSDPTGHRPCDEARDCEMKRDQTTPVKQPKWSTKNYSNQELGNSLADLSTRLQHGANFFSYMGGISEIGFTTAGLLGGTAAVGWVDLGFPIADVSGGLAGGIVGWEIGHGIHTIITNPIESGLSSASALTTYASDFVLGDTRVDIYDNNLTIVVGQPSATSATLAGIGNMNSIGVIDAAIDQVGSWYVDGNIGGAYDLFGITGKSISSPYGLLTFQFGDQ